MSPVFRHGRLRLYLLKLLDEAPRHGYEVIRLLQDRFMGVYAPSPGTIYPRLARLEEEGLVTHDEADGRKVYRITDKGREELRARLDDLAELEEEITASVRDIAREVTEDVRETVRTLREELTWAAREFHRASGGADPGGGLRHASTDEARARAEAARFREAARAKDAAEAEAAQAGEQAQAGGPPQAGEAAQTGEQAQAGGPPQAGEAAQTGEQAQAESSPQAEGSPQAGEAAQASKGAAQGNEAADAEDLPRDREHTPGGREDVPGGEARSGAEQAGAGAWRNAEDEWRDWHERWHSEAGEHAGHGHGGPGHGGPWHGGGHEHGGRGRGGKEWGEWGEWAGWTGWGGWPGAAHDWADPEAYRDLERLAKQFSRDLRSAASQAQAVSEDALSDLRGILDETIDRIKTEIFKGKAPPHQSSDPEDNPPPAD
jgi:DNA-binding PadR family transcriptional regulator